MADNALADKTSPDDTSPDDKPTGEALASGDQFPLSDERLAHLVRLVAKGVSRCLPTRPEARGPGGFHPAQEEGHKRPSCPYSRGRYYMLEGRILLTRKADTPYGHTQASAEV